MAVFVFQNSFRNQSAKSCTDLAFETQQKVKVDNERETRGKTERNQRQNRERTEKEQRKNRERTEKRGAI